MGPGQHRDRLRQFGVSGQAAMLIGVGAQDVGQRDGITVVGFLARHRSALPVAGHRHRVDRVDGSTAGPQHRHLRPARSFDRDRDRIVRVIAGLCQHGGQIGESRDRFGDAPLGQQLAVGIYDRDVVMVLGPIDPTRGDRQCSSSVRRILLGP